MRVIKATFKGKDGSRGFRKNSEYTLEVSMSRIYGAIIVTNIKSSLRTCPYENIFNFLDNWKNIRYNEDDKQKLNVDEGFAG